VYNYFKLTILMASVIFLTGCSALEERWDGVIHEKNVLHDIVSPLICRPADAIGCIGWAGNTD
jgi:hypothetical protein